MTRRLPRGAPVFAAPRSSLRVSFTLRALVTRLAALALLASAVGCGGSPVAPAAPPVTETWPAPAPLPADAIDVRAALASADGAELHVRAYLLAVTLPCPACRAGERTGTRPDLPAGKSSHTRAPRLPGCLPCPSPAATFSDAPSAAANDQHAPLRAVGAAEGLQKRHVGKPFVLTGIFHGDGPSGPELEVTAIDAVE
jgi:hypothetical protein